MKSLTPTKSWSCLTIPQCPSYTGYQEAKLRHRLLLERKPHIVLSGLRSASGESPAVTAVSTVALMGVLRFASMTASQGGRRRSLARAM